MKYYWKKIDVPNSCPRCGTAQFTEEIGTFDALLKATYSSWIVTINKKLKGKRVKRWYGSCGTCRITGMLYKRSPLERVFNGWQETKQDGAGASALPK